MGFRLLCASAHPCGGGRFLRRISRRRRWRLVAVQTECRLIDIGWHHDAYCAQFRRRSRLNLIRDYPSLMLIDDVKSVVGSALQIRDRVKDMDASAPLLGAVPELDSIAVVNLITALEEHFGITVADDEIGASVFETLGTLTKFVEGKIAG
jgi:acyl carrier protein